MSSKAGAGTDISVLKSDELPDWIKVIKSHVKLKRQSENGSTSEESGYKSHLALSAGLYGLVFERLKELEKYSNPKTKIVRFPAVFRKLCASLQITKRQAWEILFMFSNLGVLKLVPYQGIRIKNDKDVTDILLSQL